MAETDLRTPPSRNLPALSLMGLPQDEAAYEALRQGLGRLILQRQGSEPRPTLWPGFEHQIRWIDEQHLTTLGLGLPQQPLPFIPADTFDASNELLLLCSDTQNRESELVRYRPTTGLWEPQALRGRLLNLRHWEARGVTAVADRQPDQISATIWPGQAITQGQTITLPNSFEEFLWRERDDDALLLITQEMVNQNLNRVAAVYQWHCTSAAEERALTAEQPPAVDNLLWSPTGQYELQQVGDQLGLTNLETAEVESLRFTPPFTTTTVTGRYPFWSDDTQFRYIAGIPGANGRPANGLITLTRFPIEPPGWVIAQLTGSANLLQAIPLEERPETLQLIYAQMIPPLSEQLSLIMALSPPPDPEIFVFEYQHRGSQATFLSRASQVNRLEMSNSGRYVALYLGARGENPPELRLIDRWRDEITTLPLSNEQTAELTFTADDRWLALLDQGQLQLFEPETNTTYPLPFAQTGGCYELAWVQKSDGE